MITPTLHHVADICVDVGDPITVGVTAAGLRRIVPILGGTIRGERLNGTILPAGADYQTIAADGHSTLDARYAARTDNGDLLYIVNVGVRFGAPEIMARITRGEIVDPGLVYFRTTPRFETASAALHWLTRPIFVASGARYPDRVELNLFEVA